MLRETLSKIITEFPAARTQAFGSNSTAAYIRQTGATAVRHGICAQYANLRCYASAGAGNWAAVPWLAVFDPIITTSATRGYYIVYLFSASEPVVYLSLNQGTTAVQEEFGKRMYRILQERAVFMVDRLADFARDFDTSPIDLGSELTLPRGYVAGHAFGKRYALDALPSEGHLQADLQRMVQAYLALTYRGGLEPSVETTAFEGFNTQGLSRAEVVQETRRYKLHRRIERNAAGAAKAKAYHGTTCQACGFNFEAHYGPLGRDYIEAHHLRPLSHLEEGVAVNYEIAADFAVLCANCHRMIHRLPNVGDLAALKSHLVSFAQVGVPPL